MKVIRSPQLEFTVDGMPGHLAMVSKNGDGIALGCWYAMCLKGHGAMIFDVRAFGVNEDEWQQRLRANGPAILVDVSTVLAGKSLEDLRPNLHPIDRRNGY